MSTASPRKIVKNLIALTCASTRHGEASRTQILDASKIEFGQAKLACAEINTKACWIEIGIERAERGLIAAVAKANLIDACTAQHRKQAEGRHVDASWGCLRKLWKARTFSKPSRGTKREHLLTPSKSVAPGQLLFIGKVVIHFSDEAIHVILVPHDASDSRRVACGIKIKNLVQSGIDAVREQA